LIASGPNTDDWNWTREFLAELVRKGQGQLRHVYGMALHHYAWNLSRGKTQDWDAGKGDALKFDVVDWYELLREGERMEGLITGHWQVMSEFDREHHIKLIVDEWGPWYRPGSEMTPGDALEQTPTLRDAIFSGMTLDIFNRHPEKVAMANCAQLVNCLNSLYLAVTRPEMQSDMHAEALLSRHTEGPTEFLQEVMEAVHQFHGVTDSTMSHGEGWQFIQVGRYMERASATAMLLESYVPELWKEQERSIDGNEYLEWMGLLRSATAFEAYCKVYTADLTAEWILEFLLLDKEFPHSLRFSIDAMRQALESIQGMSGGSRAERLSRLSGRLRATLSYSSLNEILAGDVMAYLRDIQTQCRQIHNAIYELYVDYSIQAALAG